MDHVDILCDIHMYGDQIDLGVEYMRPHRLRGLASEYAFAKAWYEFIDDEQYQLISPTIDKGWDFMVEGNSKRLQVKRFTPQGKRYNPNTLDLRRKRNKGTGNYTGEEFDYLIVHNTTNDDIIVASIDQLKRDDGTMQLSVSICPTRKSKGLTNEGLQVLL